jgi:hypothetical protein
MQTGRSAVKLAGVHRLIRAASLVLIILALPRLAGATLRLVAATFNAIEFISYREDAPKSIGCGKPPTGAAQVGAIELLPDDYVPPSVSSPAP